MKDSTKIEFWDLLERFKDFVIRTIIVCLIIICIGMIFNGLGKIREALSPYEGEYFRPIEVVEESANFMNCYVKDMNARTIVILSRHGEVAPVIRYKALADELSSDYRVVIVENFGYGFSSNVNSERTNETMATETKEMIDALNVPKPFILLSNDESVILAMKLQSMFPEDIKAMINVDGLYPSYIEDDYVQNSILQKLSNEKTTYYLEKTGIETVLSYVRPSAFDMDKMKGMPNYYSDNELNVYRNRISNNFFSKMKIEETKNLQDNMKDMLSYEYPTELGTLSILSSEKVNEYKDLKKNKQVSNDYQAAATALVTNPDIQKVVTVDGAKGLEISNVTEEANQIKDFLSEYFGTDDTQVEGQEGETVEESQI